MQCERSPRTFWPTLVYMCIWETKKMGICGAKKKTKNPSDVTLPSLQDGTARCEQLLQRRFLSGWETPLQPGSHDLTAVRGDEAAPRCHRTVHHLIHATVALRTLSFYFTSSTLARWVRPHCCLQKNYSLFFVVVFSCISWCADAGRMLFCLWFTDVEWWCAQHPLRNSL